jgi:hypothetical protein
MKETLQTNQSSFKAILEQAPAIHVLRKKKRGIHWRQRSQEVFLFLRRLHGDDHGQMKLDGILAAVPAVEEPQRFKNWEAPAP